MPTATERLRNKFMTNEDDGIMKAAEIIKDGGGKMTKCGIISYNGNDQEVLDAIDFLCQEWDYGFEPHPEPVEKLFPESKGFKCFIPKKTQTVVIKLFGKVLGHMKSVTVSDKDIQRYKDLHDQKDTRMLDLFNETVTNGYVCKLSVFDHNLRAAYHLPCNDCGSTVIRKS